VANFYDLSRKFVCMIIAAALSVTVSVVDKMLSQRPEWAEKIALLEIQFRAISGEQEHRAAPSAGDAGTDDNAPMKDSAAGSLPADLHGLVDGYARLLEFTEHVKVRGLMLDPDFCERVEREWSVKTLLSYMVTAETSLKEQAEEAHKAAADLLMARDGGRPG
jgi:hypothetical protein